MRRLVLAAVFWGAPALAEEALTDEPAERAQEPAEMVSVRPDPANSEVLDFADQLFEQGLGSSAYIEYLRYAQSNRDSPAGDEALYRASRAVSGLDLSTHYRWSADHVSDVHRPSFMLLAQNHRYRLAVDRWERGPVDDFLEEMDDPDLVKHDQELIYMNGWIQLSIGDYEAALSSFSSIDSPVLKTHAQATIDAIDARAIPTRSKGLAMALSMVLPGSGVVYAGGELSAGATSLILSGLTGWVTWLSYAEGQHVALTSLSALSFLSVHLMQVGAAGKAAESFNEDEVSRWFESTHEPHELTVSLDPEADLRLRMELGSVPEDSESGFE